MKFSIVTISFNQAAFLERTIESVLAQAGNGVELDYIVVDPGSTDGSRDIIERYRGHIQTIVLEPDKGPGDGLNKGFAHAVGDIYGYLNSDDTLEPGALRTVADFFDRRPRIDVVSGHCWIIDSQDKRLRRMWSDRFRRIPAAYGMSLQVQPSTFFRREAFLRTNGFNNDNRCNWDGELMVDLFRGGATFENIDAFLSTYRLHEGTFTLSDKINACLALWSKRRFELLMGRSSQKRDRIAQWGWRMAKHLSHPRATYERMARGPIFQRKVS